MNEGWYVLIFGLGIVVGIKWLKPFLDGRKICIECRRRVGSNRVRANGNWYCYDCFEAVKLMEANKFATK